MQAIYEEDEMTVYANSNAISSPNVCKGTEDTTRNQISQHNGSDTVKNRSHRSVLVCLVVLCVLLLTAVIVLCVLIYTNNHQFHINNKNITQERDQLLPEDANITEEKKQLLTNNMKLTEERDQLLTKYSKIKKDRDLINEQIHKLWKILNVTDKWLYRQPSFYFISSETKSWSESRRYCTQRGADLIIINNKEEQEFAVKATSDYGVWIGLSDSDVEGTWNWVDGSTLTSGFWRSGEPNGGKSENCAVFYSSGGYDYPCDRAYKWICEINILK
ncbi:CD209 antigen-like protein C isoform X2 [Triplophysa dalaica]|uniref:CD209 antigen-like protein C isoform X2 n=1 Tax=Triplophysa dalaica TaxID=1582913 RepID=UPI0024DF7CA0|nr:CD209 antigen-like protein C isoform X2 [Triplophysa dalaica]